MFSSKAFSQVIEYTIGSVTYGFVTVIVITLPMFIFSLPFIVIVDSLSYAIA